LKLNTWKNAIKAVAFKNPTREFSLFLVRPVSIQFNETLSDSGALKRRMIYQFDLSLFMRLLGSPTIDALLMWRRTVEADKESPLIFLEDEITAAIVLGSVELDFLPEKNQLELPPLLKDLN